MFVNNVSCSPLMAIYAFAETVSIVVVKENSIIQNAGARPGASRSLIL
jgi:hypothetical protein